MAATSPVSLQSNEDKDASLWYYNASLTCKTDEISRVYSILATVVKDFNLVRSLSLNPAVDVNNIKDSASSISLKSFGIVGNSLQVLSKSSQIFVDYVTNNISIILDVKPPNYFLKMTFEGVFLIGVDESSDRSRRMHIYKCND